MVVRGITPEPATEYLQDAWAREAVRFVESHRQGPWFFYLAFNAVHTPVQATEKYLQRFAHLEDPKRRVYAAMLSAVDDGVGAVLAKLAQTGQLDRTLVVFHNDNGGPTTRNAVNGSRKTPLRGSKCETFEGGIRVPLLMQLPGVIEAGCVYREPVISIDITATAVALCGADATGLEGVDLVPFVTGRKVGSPHEALFWRCRTRSNNYGARQVDWKYVYSTEGAEQPGPNQQPARDMLFNLADGIGEWIMNRARIPVAEYEQVAKRFNPAGFNAAELVQLAKDAGMRHIMITLKHRVGVIDFPKAGAQQLTLSPTGPAGTGIRVASLLLTPAE
jgi:arylsulfatase A-like enzyme